jgi:CDP-diglyceride synthetase
MVATPLNVIGILREAITILARNGKFMLQVMLTMLFPFSLIGLLHYLLAGFFIERVEDSYEKNSPLGQKDVRTLIGLELAFFAAFFFVCFFGIMLTIHASASSYLGKNTGLNDLISSIHYAWKKPLITWLCVSLFTLTYAVLAIVLIKLVSLLDPNSYAIYLWGWFLTILAALFYLYLDASWTLALVISVLENDSCGTKGLKRSEKLIRGRKIQGFLLMFILTALVVPIYVLLYVTATDDDDDDDDELGPFAQFAFRFVATVLFCLSKFFVSVVFTVFYYECKQSEGERVVMELGVGYSLAPHKLQVEF